MILEGLAVTAFYLASKKKGEAEAGNANSPSNGGARDGFTDEQWRRFDALFKKYASPLGIDWKHLKAIALNESTLGLEKSVALGMREPANVEGSKSYDGKSWGLMQVTLVTARDFDVNATPEKLNNPEYSINLAARVYQRNTKYFVQTDPRFLEWVIKSYNQGAGNSKKEASGWRGPYYDHVQEYWARFQRNLKKVMERA